MFLGEDLETWIGERMAERSGEQAALQSAVDAKRRHLERLDAQREKRLAEIEAHGITSPVAFELIERVDAERKSLQRDIDDAEAVLAEWTAKINADGVLDWYARIRDLVGGRIAKADGVAEINAALHDSLMGVWLAYDGETLTADIKVRPSGRPEYDLLVAELFGTMPSREGSIEMLKQALPGAFTDERELAALEGTCRGSTPARSWTPRTTAGHR